MNKIVEFFKSIGPAIIIAAVVCGPGSILMSSKTGAIYGYSMIWVLTIAASLMWCMVVLSARLGVVHKHTLIEELSIRLGRPVGIFIGITLFLIVAGFQVSNNIAIVAAVETIVGNLETPAKVGVLLALNAFIIVVLYGFRDLYNPIEKIMKTIVLLMVTSFIINMIMAKPDILAMFKGLIPSPPEGGYKSFISNPTGGGNVLVLQALVATTFSVAGAFYQAYGVRAKGWGIGDTKKGMIDSLVGTCVLFGVSLVVMSTAAAALHNNPNVDTSQLNNVSDIARALEPLFGSSAKYVFACGIFAGGFGAFMVNAMIGGNMLSDGFGKGATINDRGARNGTVLALFIGMAIAIGSIIMEFPVVNVITVAQASTVLGLPALAAALIYLATRPDLTGERKVPKWMIVMGSVGFLLSLLLTLRTIVKVYVNLTATE
ncbi:MAG: divalent metal cation transporter [Verrucomicrobia bacterium]|nr:divalent metal cation transporter [Verrucomicrobiota bacterium]